MIIQNAAIMEQNFDRTRLMELVRNTMLEFINFLESRPHQDEYIDIFSPQDDGNQFKKFTRPNLNAVCLGYKEELVKLPAAIELIEYIRRFGHVKMKVSSNNQLASDSTLYHQLVSHPLWKCWSVASIEALSVNNDWVPWKLSEADLDQVVTGVSRIELEDASQIIVIAPLIGVALDNIDKLELAPGIELHAWSQAAKAVYLHKNDGYLISLDMFSHIESKCFLKVTSQSSRVFTDKNLNSITTPDRNQMEEFVGFNLSRAKLALMQAINPEHLIEELLVTTESDDTYSYSWFYPFRRQSKMLLHAQDCIITEEIGSKAVKFLKNLEDAVAVFPDLNDVLWRFDRATLASTPRDILFESTVGLESLLVHGSGENGRRFRTYGAALVDSKNFQETSSNLNKIYKLRSDNAHSSKRKLNEVEKLSVIARSYFVSVIASVVHLVVTNKINPSIKNEKRDKDESCINRSIERYLTSLMHEATHKALQGQ